MLEVGIGNRRKEREFDICLDVVGAVLFGDSASTLRDGCGDGPSMDEASMVQGGQGCPRNLAEIADREQCGQRVEMVQARR